MRKADPSTHEKEQKENDEIRIKFIFECFRRDHSSHEATRAFAVEILNDHEAIFKVLEKPELPITNNTAEQSLRCWVILRNMCHGSKTAEGSHSVAILASITDTLRKRNQEIWQFLSRVIAGQRSGLSPPILPSTI